MVDLVRTRSFDDVLAARRADARRIFRNLLDTSNPRTPEGLLVEMLAAEGHSNDRVVNRAINELLLTQARGAFLDARGVEYDVLRITASAARGSVTFNGTANTVIPADTLLRASNNAEFTTDFSASIDANGTVIVTVTATETGVAGNVNPNNNTIALAQPVVGVDSVVFQSADPFVGGGDLETDDTYRERLLQRARAAVAGGNRSDWEGWARALPNVRAARAYDPPSGGQVLLYIAFSRDAAPPHGIPSDDDLENIQNALEPRRPLLTRLSVLPVQAVTVDVTVTSVAPNSESVRTAMENAVTNYLLTTDQVGGTLFVKALEDAMNVAGLEGRKVTVPTDNVNLGQRGIPTIGALRVTS